MKKLQVGSGRWFSVKTICLCKDEVSHSILCVLSVTSVALLSGATGDFWSLHNSRVKLTMSTATKRCVSAREIAQRLEHMLCTKEPWF